MSFLSWTLSAVVCLLVLVLAVFQRRQRTGREREGRYTRRLEESQQYLQHHISRLDGFVAMLAGLYRLGMSGTGPADRRELCGAIVENACRLLQARAGSLFLRESDGQALAAAAAHGWIALEAPAVRLGEGVIGRVAETGKSVTVEDLQADRRFLREPAAPLEGRSMASVALRARDRVIGVLTVQDDSPRVFEERDVRLLGILGDHAATTLENFELYHSLCTFNIDLVRTLVHALNAKEAAGRPASPVAPFYARRIALEMSLPEQAAQFIEYAAMMRGIGKIGVDDAILRKPGKLTSEEYAAVKRHPRIASQILSPLSFLAPVAPIVLYHQEWFNGQGYPDGLSGEEIPLGARIVAVVSAWEAMISERPYRPAMSKAAAVQEVAKGAGTQFDPKVVKIFLRVLEKEDAQPVEAGAGSGKPGAG